MSALTSEQAITAVEHSSKPSTELLDDTANVIGLSWSLDDRDSDCATSSISSTNTAKFREQWALRWIIKILNRAVQAKHNSDEDRLQLVSDERTWRLLSHLLASVPTHASKDIILERNLCQAFSECLATCITLVGSNAPELVAAAEAMHDLDTVRPNKKRKTSLKQSAPQYGQTSIKIRVLIQLLRIAGQIANALSSFDGENTPKRGRMSSNWISGVDEAATFLAQLISASSIVAGNQMNNEISEVGTFPDLSYILEQWINLWQETMTASQSQRKQTPSLAFVDHVLIPALDLLATSSQNFERSVSQALERQIATSCVLPMRAIFQKQHLTNWHSTSTWGSDSSEPQWTKIQKVVDTLISELGQAAAGFRSSESQSERRGATLLSIASRIISASDAVRRKADRSWMEALFLCLGLLADRSNSKSDENQMRLPLHTSDVYVDALQATGIEPSRNFWRFYVRYAVSENGPRISLRTSAKMVQLNVSIFVPDNEKDPPLLLDDFCTTLNGGQLSDEQATRLTLDSILAPIWEEFGKRRHLGTLTRFWETKLLDAFRLHSIPGPERLSGQIWDHPDLLGIFSSVCQRHAPPSLCVSMMGTVTEDIARLTDIVGPTHEIFARIAIAEAMLKAMGTSPVLQKYVKSRDESMTSPIHKALLRKTDYSGHRWRLWKILEAIVRQIPDTVDRVIAYKFEVPWMLVSPAKFCDFNSRTQGLKSQYMELFQSFSCVVCLHENDGEHTRDLFRELLVKLNELIQMYPKHAISADLALKSWDGLSNNMDNTFKLLSACLARLARCSKTWSSPQDLPDGLFENLAYLSFGQTNSDTLTDLAIASQAILGGSVITNKVDLTDVFLSTLSKQQDMRSVPSLLQSLPRGTSAVRHAPEYFEVLMKGVKSIGSTLHQSFVHSLGLITEVLIAYSGTVLPNLDLSSLIAVMEIDTAAATVGQLVVAYQFIQKLTKRLLAQSAPAMDQIERSSRREKLLKWTKKQLEKFAPEEKGHLLDQYTGYLSLAVIQVAHDVDATTMSKKERKAIDEIHELHAAVIIQECNKLVGAPPDQVDSWRLLVLLDSLDGLEEGTSMEKKCRKCLQKVSQALVTASNQPRTGSTSAQQIRITTKLWRILSKYLEQQGSLPTPYFAQVSPVQTVQSNGHGETQDDLLLQAQLATKFPDKHSMVVLARDTHLSRIEEKLHEASSSSLAGPKAYLPVAASIQSLKLDDVKLNNEMIEVLGNIASLQTALEETSLASMVARLELSKMVLDKHPSIVNQHVIDSTLRSVTNMASSASKATITTDSNDVSPEHIFDRLCTILSILLVRYRRRLAGRHHLFLPALQNLLKCLFYPDSQKTTSTANSSKYTYLASLPPWLKLTTQTNTTTSSRLPPSSATKFARLLQQLSDPSASSARHVSKRYHSTSSTADNNNHNLTDDVKSLRREVSRYTQYLLQSYCQVMLDGYIAPDVKEKLLPGLYAVMNAMDVEVMRGLNAAMGESQRAVWKDLYAEWGRFGRWNQR